MEDYITIETLLIAIVFLLALIAYRLGGIFSKIAEIREESYLLKRRFIPKDDW
jgi:hypothetical protein